MRQGAHIRCRQHAHRPQRQPLAFWRSRYRFCAVRCVCLNLPWNWDGCWGVSGWTDCGSAPSQSLDSACCESLLLLDWHCNGAGSGAAAASARSGVCRRWLNGTHRQERLRQPVWVHYRLPAVIKRLEQLLRLGERRLQGGGQEVGIGPAGQTGWRWRCRRHWGRSGARHGLK